VAGFSSLLGPSVAGLLLTGYVDGRAGYRDLWSRLRRWRVGVRWYAVALLTAPLVNAATVIVLSLTSAEYVPDILTSNDKLTPLLLGLVGGLAVAIFEELGWTGFAMPRFLTRHGVLTTGLIMGVLWGVWHLPLFAGNAASAAGVSPVVLMAAMLFAWLVPYRVLMVWVHDRTQSLLLVMLMHVPIVAGAYVFNAAVISAQGMVASLVAYGAALWVVVGVIALANGGRLTLPRPVPAATEGMTA
jgi:membrane protease YdiL (CAAX protease family)